MTPHMMSSFSTSDSSALLEKLTSLQHLHPHWELKRVLELAVLQLEYCPASVRRAMHWLDLGENLSIGRVRRTEIVQLARSIHRFSSQMRLASVRQAVVPVER